MTNDASRESFAPDSFESGDARGANPDQPSVHDDGFQSQSGDDAADSQIDSTAGGSAEGESAGGAEAGPGDRPRRRRGSRGGRRRRGARKQEGDKAGTAEVAFDDTTPDRDGPVARRSAALAPREIGFESDGEFTADSDLEPEGDDENGSEPAAAAAEHAGPVRGPHKKKRRRRGRRRGGRDNAAAAASEDGPVEPPFADEDDIIPVRAPGRVPRELDAFDEDGEHAGEKEGGDFDPEAAFDDGEFADDGRTSEAPGVLTPAGGKKRRRRGTRGGRGRKKQSTEARAVATPSEAPADVETIPGEDDDLPFVAQPGSPGDRAGEQGRRSEPRTEGRGKKRGRRRGARGGASVEDFDDEGAPAVPESQRTSLILVNATDPEEHRVAVVEDDRIVDFQMTVRDQDSLVNDIYRGRVVNLEPAIGAAFIDFGQGRNGFLHTSDVLSMYGEKDWSLDKLLSAQIDPEEWDAGSAQPAVGAELSDDDAPEKSSSKKARRQPRPEKNRRFRARPRLPITDLLKKGQMVVVQVTKDAIGDKGPTLTTYISIPGRYLVLMPSMSRTGVSRKIEDEKERKRLKRILTSLEVPDGMGVIVRTAGVGHSKDEIKRDLDYLKGAWDAFGKRLGSGNGPAPLYRESDVAIRTMRDLFTPTTKAVVVDDPEVHRHITEFTEQLMPENVERVKLHTGPRPLFQSYGIEPDFEKIFSRRIELPSGGSIVFDSAEALVAIDVNSGRTRSDGFDFEAIALKTNLEAVPEIARQIRLRDLGGIIVVDFIDMMKMSNIRTVERVFKEALEGDRARSKIGRISQFGLLELTRQRLGPGIAKKAFHACPRCRGTGRIRTVNSRAAAILRRLASAMILKGFSTVEVRAHPEVVRYLKDACSEYIRALEYRFTREVKLFEAPDQHEDSILRYLRADGREVRPGGRRKR
ncbi:MAG: Rne/Rng family ribonuclease [Planctomycetes bacterium]|nr:Rne/Rng family ribonuclease [Planctomycetota bacterium]